MPRFWVLMMFQGNEKQTGSVRSVFRRQLTIPLGNIADTLEEYKEWEAVRGISIGDDLNGLPPNVVAAYKKAVQLCSIRDLHEGKIAKGKSADAELLQHYLVRRSRMMLLLVSVFPSGLPVLCSCSVM